jgi:hypothetical protein
MQGGAARVGARVSAVVPLGALSSVLAPSFSRVLTASVWLLSYDYKMDSPMANLLVTIRDSAGVPIEKPGDSTGPLKLEALR